MSVILIPGSPGELIDKITILEIKFEKILDVSKRMNVGRELEALSISLEQNIIISTELAALKLNLKKVNEVLWDIEDDIRSCERKSDFGPIFVKLARSVYFQNDRRAALKKEINVLLGSDIIEEKSYAKY
ncbi:MAG: hypothetical protein CMM39_14915 [Rhodospirillaceae bacterium]|jgi:hypothetical protein|nr:hypothetical protein [Rhodospirillaceae bacterium]MBT5911743.1 hypothetical protein [Rhodospirillaceae bacterium]MBT6305169.1 hypothetical protein [Rhodospirillaceae bacterium]MDG1886529.1 DUF6165 family protein [Alphaproteobacteria bacterium]|tara:strand:+ start:4919 stop:5308 length:390 start_codon:yes stop_codon:yes gene_type:complete